MAQIDPSKIPDAMRAWREQLQTERAAKQQELDEIDQNLRKVEAFFNPQAPVAPAERRARAPSTDRAPRARQGERSPLYQDILRLIEQYMPNGAKAEAINDELGARDEEAKKPIAAALYRMKTQGLITQPKARGPYTLGTNYRASAAEKPAAQEPATAAMPAEEEATA
jgi:hypothetical protein